MTDLERRSHELFSEAIEKSPSEWPSFLETKCDSPDLRNRVQALLDAHIQSGDFLNETAIEAFPKLAFPFGGQIEEFKILRLIGSGGMGHVYLAEDTILKRLVALKIIECSNSFGDTNYKAVERFQREARAAARLVHPSVVQVYRTGEKEGLSYIAMEYVEGTTLGEKFEAEIESAELRTTERFQEVAELISQIADAVDHAHRVGVIHRDVKPSNILIDTEGNARLADFGIAKVETEETLQRTGTIVGSCAYMSPEQARIVETKVDHRTDIFSLGVVLYEAICLQRPFGGSTFNDVMKALSDCSPKPLEKVAKKIPRDLAVVCHKAMEKQVTDRYQSAAHFYADLRCFIDGKPILARPPSYQRRIGNWVQKNQRTSMLTVITLLVVTVLGLTITIQTLLRQQMGYVEISVKHEGEEVKIAKYSDEMILGAFESVGTAPTSIYLSPGIYRIQIEDDDFILEATSYVTPGFVDRVSVNRPKKESLDALVEIAGGEYELGNSKDEYLLHRKRKVVLSSFWISPTEVSNREYQQYILATKADPPYYWSELDFKKIEDLPVTEITWDEANLYCRWRGVRMPTPDEWEAASKGPGKSAFPSGEQLHSDIRRQEARRLNFESYLKFARPVDSDVHLATPVGVKHMVSNVQEYTEGISTDKKRRLVLKGRSWRDSVYHEPWKIITISDRGKKALNRGFRVMVSTRSKR